MVTSDHGAGSGSGNFVDGAPSYASNRNSSHDPAPPVVNKQLWLDAWNDPVAGISAYTPCIHACNLMGDGDYRLIVADSDRKLKVGAWLTSTQTHCATSDINIPTTTSCPLSLLPPNLPPLSLSAYPSVAPSHSFAIPLPS